MIKIVATGAAAARRAHLASNGGDDGGDARGLTDDNGRRADFAYTELADDAGDFAATAVTRYLARGPTILAGGEGGGGRGRGGGGGSAGASGSVS